MKLNKPKFWEKKNIISILLLPLSIAYLLIFSLVKKITKPKEFNIPVLCVGNIYLGGTGKTPTSIFLSDEISKQGKKTVILRKYYKNHIDEYNLINNNSQNLIINKDRQKGIEVAEKDYDVVILDDGFQDHKIKKNLNIICFNSNQLVGNGFTLPSGPLRESLNSLKDVKIVIINGTRNFEFEKKILKINKNLKIFNSFYKPNNVDQFKNKNLLAIAGIGNPENFFRILKENSLDIKEQLIFPDHYQFTKAEFKEIAENAKEKNYQIITTEKDFYKVKDFDIKGLKYLKVSLEINKKDELIKLINEIYDKKN